jgi:hypothetical protein
VRWGKGSLRSGWWTQTPPEHTSITADGLIKRSLCTGFYRAMCLHHTAIKPSQTLPKVCPSATIWERAMILKLLGLQRLLDELFEDNWLEPVALIEV